MSSDHELYVKTLENYNDPIFAKQYADNITDRLDTWIFDEFLPFVPDGGKILDIGSAGGRDSAYMHAKGYAVTGIDYSRELTTIAQSQYPDSTFIQGDFTELPFGDDSFAGIYCKAALVHLPSMALVEQALSEFYRVLQPDGYILLCTKARLGDQPETAIKKDPLSDRERYFRYQDEAEFLKLCKQVGFTILMHKVFNEKDHQYTVKRDENWVLVLAQNLQIEDSS